MVRESLEKKPKRTPLAYTYVYLRNGSKLPNNLPTKIAWKVLSQIDLLIHHI